MSTQEHDTALRGAFTRIGTDVARLESQFSELARDGLEPPGSTSDPLGNVIAPIPVTPGFSGMDRTTGKLLIGSAHLSQSLGDLLAVPIGSRIQRRGYGLPVELIDAPITPETMIEIVAAVAAAVRRWEPRILLRRVRIQEAGPEGVVVLLLTADIPAGAAAGIDPGPQELRIPLTPPKDCDHDGLHRD